MITEGIAEILSGFKDSKVVIGPRLSSMRSIILSDLKESRSVIGPIIPSLGSIVSPRITRYIINSSEQQESNIQVHPRHFGTAHLGLRAILGHQTLTRSGIDRTIMIDDVYGKRKFILSGVRFINNMAELRAAVARFKLEHSIQQIDAQQGIVSIKDAVIMWRYLRTEGATGLLKHDSVLLSLVLQASLIQDNLNNVEACLARAQSIVEELEVSRETLLARLNGVVQGL